MSAPRIDQDPQRNPTRRRRRAFDVRRDGKWIVIALALLLLANIAFWYVGVRPIREDIAALEERKASADQAERQARSTLDALRRIAAHTDAVKTGVDRFYDDMLSTKGRRMVPFQKALIDVGERFRVEPERVDVNINPLEAEGLEVMGFNFPLEGGYENLRQFLAELEALDQFLIVREINLQGGREGGRQLQLNVALETYFNNPEVRERLERERAMEAQERRARRRGGR